ncbi:hypothetical protein BPOR_0190g00140 [Botrytis porri]|uniref:Glycoside hydrolase family 127 protein n=1 Tax=Botrytis porri TaxID=87229 RepID=A0A4Z1KU28_9HELO|nr:hypothetical protein BPOR_0190g00140 [Botrytis porri]
MAQKKMYLTGGIGAIKQWEGFGIDCFLPSGTDEGGCYSETCASIGVMMLAERLLQIDLDAKYADIMELCFYNAGSIGMLDDGSKFTYANQLASSDTDLSRRADWFKCACCPPNVARLLGYIGGHLWTSSSDEKKNTAEINVHTYASAVLSIPVGRHTVQLEQKTDWPWDGNIQFELKSLEAITTTIRLRIPGWAKDRTISPEFDRYASKVTKGYLTLPPEYLKTNLSFQLNITLKPRFISPHPYTNQNIIALARGPIIYCVEDFDNPWSLVLDTECEITETDVNSAEPYKELTVRDGATLLKVPESSGPYLAHNKNNFAKVDI